MPWTKARADILAVPLEATDGSAALLHTPSASPAVATSAPRREKRPRHTRNKWQASWTKASKKGPTFAYCTVIRAELYFTSFIVEHNRKVMFPDSPIAQRYSCSRTKTKAIVTHALAPAANSPVAEACANQPFSILCDGGNDMLDKKYFAIIVRFWDECLGKSVTRFIAMPVCNIATGQSLFDVLEAELLSRWMNVVGFVLA